MYYFDIIKYWIKNITYWWCQVLTESRQHSIQHNTQDAFQNNIKNFCSLLRNLLAMIGFPDACAVGNWPTVVRESKIKSYRTALVDLITLAELRYTKIYREMFKFQSCLDILNINKIETIYMYQDYKCHHKDSVLKQVDGTNLHNLWITVYICSVNR